jgi:hypothetical protein
VVDGEKRYDARAQIRGRVKLQKKKAKKEDERGFRELASSMSSASSCWCKKRKMREIGRTNQAKRR